jgi:hypothetical protein
MDERVYACWSARAMALVIGPIAFGMALVLPTAPDFPRPWALVAGAAVAVVWHAYWRTRVQVWPDGILVVNPWRTHRIPFGQVAGITAGDFLPIRLRDGTLVRAWAVQAMQARGPRQQTYAKRVSAEVRAVRDGALAAGRGGGEAAVAWRRPSIVGVLVAATVGVAGCWVLAPSLAALAEPW